MQPRSSSKGSSWKRAVYPISFAIFASSEVVILEVSSLRCTFCFLTSDRGSISSHDPSRYKLSTFIDTSYPFPMKMESCKLFIGRLTWNLEVALKIESTFRVSVRVLLLLHLIDVKCSSVLKLYQGCLWTHVISHCVYNTVLRLCSFWRRIRRKKLLYQSENNIPIPTGVFLRDTAAFSKVELGFLGVDSCLIFSRRC
ncbi:hypothetical protein Rs2_23304 [Raphanus sativus]|nr:hypothetical protein Rs2_23304 [Raphanus sativus]